MNKKTVRVEIKYEDGSGIYLEGEEAEKWAKAVEGQGTLMFVHGWGFPELTWQKYEKIKTK